VSRLCASVNGAVGRLLPVAVVTFIAAMSASAARPSQASALSLSDLNPVKLIGKGVETVFGGVAGAAGNAVVDGFSKLLQWMFAGLADIVNVVFIKFVTEIQLEFTSSLKSVVGPSLVIGGFLLIMGLFASSLRAMATVTMGTDKVGRAFGGVAFKVGTLLILMASWFTLLPLAVDIANGLSGYVRNDAAVKAALAQTFEVGGAGAAAGTASCAATGVGCVVTPALFLILLLMLVFTIVAVLIMKYVLMFMFAVEYVGGPVLLGAGAFPGIGEAALNMLARVVLVSMAIPLAWTIVFAAWAGVLAGLVDAPEGLGEGVIRIVNGPGLLLAANIVLLGVTRALTKLASPLSAPLSIPGMRLLTAGLAIKMGGPALAAAKKQFSNMGSGGSSSGPSRSVTESATPSAASGSGSNAVAGIAAAGATVATGGTAAPVAAAAAGGSAAAGAAAGAGAAGSAGGAAAGADAASGAAATAADATSGAGTSGAEAASADGGTGAGEPAATARTADAGAPQVATPSDALARSSSSNAPERTGDPQTDARRGWEALSDDDKAQAFRIAQTVDFAGAAANDIPFKEAFASDLAGGAAQGAFADPESALRLGDAHPKHIQEWGNREGFGETQIRPPTAADPGSVQSRNRTAGDLGITEADLASLRKPPPA
jgi:hypothetical protein